MSDTNSKLDFTKPLRRRDDQTPHAFVAMVSKHAALIEDRTTGQQFVASESGAVLDCDWTVENFQPATPTLVLKDGTRIEGCHVMTRQDSNRTGWVVMFSQSGECSAILWAPGHDRAYDCLGNSFNQRQARFGGCRLLLPDNFTPTIVG